jgi:hypothetical protein
MRSLILIAVIVAAGALSTAPARACDPDSLTDERCDDGDRASGRMPAEPWGDFYARKDAELHVDQGDAWQDQGAGGRRRHR